ncbi:hypothetical protein [Tichowtungia aerotolerans]|uniref:Lipoprotein n=1 Tax=Tichowtungia aerotolerans TaxID=2697043 RepID=A0A6P1M8I2_9BACT|nr:hypothetical protein [Tichowtungia aerotolerans]QHI69373.1 hypothetical protein GT409_07880 [Tichowtungia aerotolerans]
MKLKWLICGIAVVLLSGCAGIYMSGWTGPTATVVYIQDTGKEHFFSVITGEVIPETDIDSFAGESFSSRHGVVQSTAVYAYESEQFSDHPALLGSCGKAPLSKTVKAGVPLRNLYRTRYQTSARHSYQCQFTTSVFTPETGKKYEVVVEPIDGVEVYELSGTKRIRLDNVSRGPEGTRF